MTQEHAIGVGDQGTRRRQGGAVALHAAWLLSAVALLWWAATPELIGGGLMALVYGPEPSRAAAPTGRPVQVRVHGDAVAARVQPELISFAVDTSQVVGGHWWGERAQVEWPKGEARTEPLDFSRAGLARYARALAPAYLRIGGTEADSVYYAEADEPTPDGYELRLSRAQWDALVKFTRDTGNQLMFTLNAGPGPRDAQGRLGPSQTERLLRRASEQAAPVAVWELGNEVNAFWITHGLWNALGAEQYGRDVRMLRRLSERFTPSARIAGPGLVVWPRMGEPPPRRLDAFAAAAGDALDILTWHYYPQQSRRCPVATRRAAADRLLAPWALDEAARWAAYVEAERDRTVPEAQVWLGETGGAQCGGEPGVSDRFASSLWWLDQLGLLARRGQPVVVRQTLVGSHYGLLDDESLEPRPDYYASLLHKQLMGERVLDVTTSADDPWVRVYAHCAPSAEGRAPGAVSVLAIHLGDAGTAQLSLQTSATGVERFEVRADDLAAERVRLNGRMLTPSAVGTHWRGDRQPLPDTLALAPHSYTFLVLEDAGADACL